MEELGLAIDATVSLGNKEIAFSRSALFKAIRNAFESVDEEFCVEDINSKIWSLRNYPGERPAFSLTKGDEQIINKSCWPLCADVDRRIEYLRRRRRIDGSRKRSWSAEDSSFRKTAVSDDDVTDLSLDLDCSPSHIEALLRQEFQGPSKGFYMVQMIFAIGGL